jgi:glycosyltransferase involved in cell wall biosynthesis
VRKIIATHNNWRIVIADIRWHSLHEQFRFASLLTHEQLDLMHFPYFSLPVLYKKPFVVTIHDLIIHHFPTGKASTLPVPLYQVKRFGYEQVLRHAIRSGKKIIVPLPAVKADLMREYRVPSEKISVTLEGFDSALTKSSRRKPVLPFPSYFLAVGNAYPHKNLGLLLSAYVSYRAAHPDATIGLVLAGKDSYFYRKLHAQVQKEQIPGIIFLHDLSDADLASLYRHAVCLIAPSLMEGFGLTALEAMGLSCLPVVADIPAFHEVCQEAAVYFDPKSVGSLLEKMDEAVSLTPQEKAAYLKKGQERLKAFSWQSMAEETLAIYESCVSV